MVDYSSIVFTIHIVFVIYMIMFPFLSRDRTCLLHHAFILCFIMFHWLVNSDTCALTELEYWLRSVSKPSTLQKNQTFFGSIISPVYNLENVEMYKATILLTLFTFHRALTMR